MGSIDNNNPYEICEGLIKYLIANCFDGEDPRGMCCLISGEWILHSIEDFFGVLTEDEVDERLVNYD